MIIILKGADFSASNIGHIDIDVQFERETNEILAKYSKILTLDQKKAFNEFVYTIKSIGVYAKINTLILPILSANLNEAGLNAKTGLLAFASNLSSLSLINNGLKPIAGANVANFSLSEIQKDFHLAAYNTTNDDFVTFIDPSDGVTVKKYSSIVFGNVSDSAYLVGKHSQSSNTLPSIASPFGNILGDSNFATTQNLLIANSSNDKSSLCIDGQIVNGKILNGVSPINSCKFGAYNLSTYTGNPIASSGYTQASWGLFSFGKSLTDSEMVNYTTAVNLLMSELNV